MKKITEVFIVTTLTGATNLHDGLIQTHSVWSTKEQAEAVAKDLLAHTIIVSANVDKFTLDTIPSNNTTAIERGLLQPGHVEPKLPSWVKPGQWVQNNQTEHYYKIDRIDKNYVFYTSGALDKLTTFKLPNFDYTPVRISPWSIQEAVDFCDSGVAIRVDGTLDEIIFVSKRKGNDEAKVILANGQEYDLSDLAKAAETDNFNPCGTPVPM